MNGYALLAIIAICLSLIHITDEILEQRRRETKTGEFSESEDDE